MVTVTKVSSRQCFFGIGKKTLSIRVFSNGGLSLNKFVSVQQ